MKLALGALCAASFMLASQRVLTAATPKTCDEILDAKTLKHIRNLKGTVDSIVEFITVKEKGVTWSQLAEFVDRHGPRFTGTTFLEAAIDDRVKYFSDVVGQNGVHTEDVEIPKWSRGETEVVLLNAWEGGRNKTLSVLTLGYSVGTPTSDGFVADAIVVRSFDELRNKSSDEVKGKIVVFNEPWVSYGVTAQYRSRGASEAAAKGGVAALIRSATGYSLYTPHTGMMSYGSSKVKVPAISITVEDAELMWRKQQRGEALRLFVRSTAELNGKGTSRNTVAEIKGRSSPDEVVIFGGHIDSWDVGQGALDDGGGSAISWRVLDVLHKMKLVPRRTVRAVLFVGEEMGIIGGQAYFAAHKDQADSVQFIMESDFGTFTPLGLSSAIKNLEARCIISESLKLLNGINATQLIAGGDGPDIGQWFDIGVPGGSLTNANEKYFNYHHTNADMMQMLSPDDLDKATVVWTAMAYVFAEIEKKIPHDSAA